MNKEGAETMPLILPIRELRNTSEISDMTHKEQEPIFIQIDQAIYESEKETNQGGESISLEDAFERLNKKYYTGINLD